jgi:hypothetical protein
MKKSELRQLIKEELERHVTDRMEGLTSIPALNSFKSGAITILNELSEEGFELDEISEYLHSILDMQLNPRNVRYGLDEASDEEVENQKELNKELEKTSNLKKQMSSLSEVSIKNINQENIDLYFDIFDMNDKDINDEVSNKLEKIMITNIPDELQKRSDINYDEMLLLIKDKNISLRINKALKLIAKKYYPSLLSEVEDEDDDTVVDKEPTAKDLKNDSVAVLGTKLKKIKAEMKSTVDKWKKSEGKEKENLQKRLKELTTQKREIEKLL